MPELSRVFVYGTLRQGFTNRGRDILDHHAEPIGPGETAGRLYDLGDFPALVEDGETAPVRGEVYELTADPERALERLDRYEGAHGANPLPYERRARTVHLDEGRDVQAWVYVWTDDTGSAPQVPSGDWIEHVTDKR